jgi:choline dehydrogenase
VIFNQMASVTEFEFFSVSNITGMVFSPTLPFSWGSIHLDATGAVNNPAIDPNFLGIDFDLQTAIAAGRFARKLWATKPLNDFVGAPLVPGYAQLPENATDEQWATYLVASCRS